MGAPRVDEDLVITYVADHLCTRVGDPGHGIGAVGDDERNRVDALTRRSTKRARARASVPRLVTPNHASPTGTW